MSVSSFFLLFFSVCVCVDCLFSFLSFTSLLAGYIYFYSSMSVFVCLYLSLSLLFIPFIVWLQLRHQFNRTAETQTTDIHCLSILHMYIFLSVCLSLSSLPLFLSTLFFDYLSFLQFQLRRKKLGNSLSFRFI